MNKISEKLIEKYLLPTIREVVLKVYKEQFNKVFRESCKTKSEKDTTIGHTFRQLEKLALVEVKETIDKLFENTSIYSVMKTKPNPMQDLIFALIDEFEYYLDLQSWVESVLGDEWGEKEEELYQKGYVDVEGDWTGEALEDN